MCDIFAQTMADRLYKTIHPLADPNSGTFSMKDFPTVCRVIGVPIRPPPSRPNHPLLQQDRFSLTDVIEWVRDQTSGSSVSKTMSGSARDSFPADSDVLKRLVSEVCSRLLPFPSPRSLRGQRPRPAHSGCIVISLRKAILIAVHCCAQLRGHRRRREPPGAS